MVDANLFINPPDDKVRAVLETMRRIAVVGLSAKPDRASHGIARFLIGQGFEVVGVNPLLTDGILDIPVYATLADVPGPVDVVDVFRRSDTVPPIIEAAIARQDRCVWLQEGVVHPESAASAVEAGLDVIMDRCLYKEWLRLRNG